MSYIPDAESQPSSVTKTLSDAEEIAIRTDQEQAYQLSLEATQATPENIKDLLTRAESTASIEETVACLNQANVLQPLNPGLEQKTYQIVQKIIEQDPFLLYLNETDDLYHVRSGEELTLIIPKSRATPEAYPAKRPVLLKNAYRWLWLGLLGLLPAGLGAIVFAPLAAISAIGLYLTDSSKANRIHSLVVIILSGSLWLCGLLLVVILLIHMV